MEIVNNLSSMITELQEEIIIYAGILNDIEIKLNNSYRFEEILELIKFKNSTIKYALFKLILLKQYEFDLLYILINQLV